MTTAERDRLITAALDEIRPNLKRDGGDCELVEIDGDKVFVRLTGACVGCILASVTVAGMQKRLVEKTGLPLRVIPVTAAKPRPIALSPMA
jgi:NifU-like protein